jgi:hypothetical protein
MKKRSIQQTDRFQSLSYDGSDEYADITVFMGPVEMWKTLQIIQKICASNWSRLTGAKFSVRPQFCLPDIAQPNDRSPN